MIHDDKKPESNLTAYEMINYERRQYKRVFAKSVWEPGSQFTKNKHSSRKVRTSPTSKSMILSDIN